MQTTEKCPRCREGKLVERTFTKSEHDSSMSVVMGLALGMGYFPMEKQVEYAEYTCNRNCGYREEKKR